MPLTTRIGSSSFRKKQRDTVLEEYLARKSRERKILLMTHIVIGYPSFEQSLRLVDIMVDAGVDLIELQIPFSEPIADGPVIARANQRALAAGSTVECCFSFAEQVGRKHSIPFLFMSYYNLLYRRGTAKFIERMAAAGLKGAIVPDLPWEEATDYLLATKLHRVAPIFIFSPTTDSDRMATIAEVAEGFIYCVARQGVTGQETRFSPELSGYLARCRAATKLPLALGFGVRNRNDVTYLEGKVDIAVVGSETLRIVDEKGVKAAGEFIRGLRN
jgi:tryptophan synthase alpha chain